jgi:hypothetical protein
MNSDIFSSGTQFEKVEDFQRNVKMPEEIKMQVSQRNIEIFSEYSKV